MAQIAPISDIGASPAAAASRAWRFTARGPPRTALSLDAVPLPALPPPAKLLSSLPEDVAPRGGPWIRVRVIYAALNPGGLYFVSAADTSIRSGHRCSRVAYCCPSLASRSHP